MKQQQEQFTGAGPNLMLWAAYVGADCVRPFVNSGRGTTANRFCTFVAFLAIPCAASVLRSADLVMYWYAWIFFVVYRRITADRSQDTDYIGNPWLARWLSLGLLGHDAARLAEPFVVFGISYLFTGPVALLIRLGGICMLVQVSVWRVRARRERDARHNAAIRGRNYL